MKEGGSKMTREEQIKLAAENKKNEFCSEYQSFVLGATWADEHPNLYNNEKYHTVKVSCLDELNRKAVLYDEFLEKACKYLSETLMDNNDNCGYDVVSSFDTITLNEYIEDFKRAMEK